MGKTTKGPATEKQHVPRKQRTMMEKKYHQKTNHQVLFQLFFFFFFFLLKNHKRKQKTNKKNIYKPYSPFIQYSSPVIQPITFNQPLLNTTTQKIKKIILAHQFH